MRFPVAPSARDDRRMTALPPGYRAVDLPSERRADVVALDQIVFPDGLSTEAFMTVPLPLTWERARGVEADDGELVAMHSSYAFAQFPVPGARTAVSGLTWVGVHPGHRRRGLLSTMIDEHFRRSLQRGEAVSALFAAEPGIYGRFGYGLAAMDLRVKVPRGSALRDVPGSERLRVRIETLDAERHGDLVRAVHSAVDRPGWATRESAAHRAAHLADPEATRDGMEASRIVVVEDDGVPVAYAIIRRRSSWQDAGPRGTVHVRDATAPQPAAARALWGVLLDLDLMATVDAWPLALDDPLFHLLVDARSALTRISDNLWVRLLDVPRALEQRRYATDVDVVLEVTDARLPANAGRWHLRGDDASAEVSATDRSPDLTVDVRELGAAYLGGMSLAGLAGAGLVGEHTDGALRRTATAFGWHLAPVCSFVW